MEIDEQQEPGEENEQAPAQVLQQDVEIVINQEAVDGEGSDDGGEDSGEENFQQVQGDYYPESEGDGQEEDSG